jgi:hypothetical protein
MRKLQIEERFFRTVSPRTRLASVTYINFYSRVAVENSALRIIDIVITVSGLQIAASILLAPANILHCNMVKICFYRMKLEEDLLPCKRSIRTKQF